MKILITKILFIAEEDAINGNKITAEDATRAVKANQ